jgi:hypothetical protein
MPWLWQPNSPVGQPNGLGPPMLNYAAPPNPAAPTVGQGVAQTAQTAWQWLQDQRAESVRQGLLDPDTGLPTQKGLVEGAKATAEGVMMGTTAPGAKTIEVGGRALPLNPDGTVTLFHATKTPEAANQIVANKTLSSAGEPSVYLSTAPTGTGYGDHVVSVKVNPAHLNIDDEFPDGRADFRIDRKAYPVSDAQLLPGGGTTAPGDVPPPGIVAYHGSPHSFDQFDTSKIGTGEGAQAYGHGLYFAEGEGVARSYRDALVAEKGQGHYWQDASGNKVDIEALSNSAEKGNPQGFAASMLRQSGSVDEAINDVTKYGPSAFIGGKPEMDATLAGLQDLKARGLERIKDTGHMYEVNIGADPEHFLDWDKPLSEQHPVVQDALKNTPYPPHDMSMSVRQHMAELETNREGVTRTGDPAALAAQALRDAGIPGIRYLDQGSRGAGQGTHNYVVFDPATIEILRKYGLAGLIAGGGAAAAGTQQQQPSQ